MALPRVGVSERGVGDNDSVDVVVAEKQAKGNCADDVWLSLEDAATVSSARCTPTPTST